MENNETIKNKQNLKRGSIKQEWRRQLHAYKSKSRHAIVSIPLINNGQQKGKNRIDTSATSDQLNQTLHRSFPSFSRHTRCREGRGRGYSAVTIQKNQRGEKNKVTKCDDGQKTGIRKFQV